MAVAAHVVTPEDLNAYQAGDQQTMINQATAAVRSYCGWHVTPQITETITVAGSGGQWLVLPTLQLVGVNAVTNADNDPYTSDDYTWLPHGVLHRTPDCGIWARGGTVTLTMTHGYDEAPDLAGVILARAARVQSNGRGATRVQAGPFSEQYDTGTGFTADETAVLDRYRLPPRP